MTDKLNIILAQPRGFCAGVKRAIDIVEKALDIYGSPIYVRHEIVHNKWVVEDLRSKGVIFVDEVSMIPDGAITVFSAHGISQKVENSAVLRDLPFIDATCPLVTKVHKEAIRYEDEGFELILIGHKGHPEVEGTVGRVKQQVHLIACEEDVLQLTPNNPDKLAYVTQTTLSVDDTANIIAALKKRFPDIQGPDLRDICYATQNRQNVVRELARKVDLILVIGSINSSNSNRLRDLGEEMGVKSYLIDDENGINPDWLQDIKSVGVTAGASAPEILVDNVLAKIGSIRSAEILPLEGITENTRFKLPPEVTDKPFAIAKSK
ncbi:MAG: 4-hydroxy-3-methylbut-2-enyl diphosphate reductase [Pseudomonadota bacterium]